MPFNKLPLDFNADNKSHIVDLHAALTRLDILPKLDKKPPAPKKLDDTLKDAVKTFKTNNQLGRTATLDAKTIAGLNVALHDQFMVSNKSRVSNLHKMLDKLGFPVDKDEAGRGKAGESTRKAITDFQKARNLPPDGKVSEELLDLLDRDFIEKKFTAKVQVDKLQKNLLYIRRIAKIETRIDESEIKGKVIGPSTTAFIETFQAKYKLKPTGQLDRATLDKIESVAASRGVAQPTLKKTNVQELKNVGRALRLNMIHPDVNQAQQALTQLGFKIDEKEHKTQTFGKTTREAVVAFQRSRGLSPTGHVEGDTLKAMKVVIGKLNPAADAGLKYRIRGSVRDEMWQRRNNMVLKIYEKLVDGKSAQPLMTKKNMLNGFFDISYDPPRDKNTGQIKKDINLLIELYQSKDSNPANDVFIEAKILNGAARIQWVNFTLGDQKYQGDADFTVSMDLIDKALGDTPFLNISEQPDNRQITQLSAQTGMSADDITRLLLAHQVAAKIATDVTPATIYAFLRQNLPADLPGDLFFPVSISWDTMAVLVEKTVSGIGFLDAATHTAVLETAIAENLVPRTVFKDKDGILKALADLQIYVSLNSLILVGNGNLKTLLTNSSVPARQSALVAGTFLQHQGFNEAFWQALTDAPGVTKAQVQDLKTTVDLGGITKNFEPVLKAFKGDIGRGQKFSYLGDIAKLSQTELEDYLKANGSQVPDNFNGTTTEKISAYATALKIRSEALYPAVALTASIQRTAANALPELGKVEKFLDSNPDFKLKEETVDTYLAKKNLNVDETTKASLKTVVRIQKIAGNASVGAVLAENKLHSSTQVYFAGKNSLIAKGISDKLADRVFETAKSQYALVLAKFTQLRPEFNLGTPAAIAKQTYTKEELAEWVGDIPNLESLFGSLDFCECEHCKSLYGPAAYLTDMLRFLKEHTSLLPPKTVKDILFDRRPDLGNIKLNCANTDTPLPYIDLVCEVLENTIPTLPAQADFDFQTTLTQQELQAMPQNVREEAYDLLATANFPMNSSFDLWQEEARTYLGFLGIPRYEVMEKFRNISNLNNKKPDDAAIAAEYFNISVYEKGIITKDEANKTAQERYWGFDAVKDVVWQDPAALNQAVSVRNFMDRSQLSYNEVLELLLVQFVNPAGASQSDIVRPVDSCSTDVQQVNNLTFVRLDLMHRFLRLWRRTGWKMWELDLILRNPVVGKNKIDGETLANLKAFRQVQTRLALPTEIMLAFYGTLNTEPRVRPENPDVAVPSLYEGLFQNPTIIRPLDLHFTLPLDNTLVLGTNAAAADYTPVPTILSALSIPQTDFDLIVGKTDGQLSLASLSTLLHHAYLAKGMRVSMGDLLLLMGINSLDPFASPQQTADFLKSYDTIKSSGLSIGELDYILNDKPDSPIGWRDETYAQVLDNLINTLQLSREGIDKLQLTPTERQQILDFDTNALAALPDDQVVPGLTPLVTILSDHQTTLDDAKFAQEERSYIVSFQDAAPLDATRKTNLIQNIEALQQALLDLLNQAGIQVQALVAGTFALPENQVSILLDFVFPPSAPKTLQEILGDEVILAEGADLSVQQNALMLIHKIAMLIQKMGLDEKNLQWFADHSTEVTTVDFAALPTAALARVNQYTEWLNLHKFLAFANAYPEPENASLRTILEKVIGGATKEEIFAEINAVTQWDTASSTNLPDLDGKLVFTKAEYLKASTYERLQAGFAALKIAGVDANTLFGWNDPANRVVATQTRLAIKSKYENDDWLAKITPLQDDLRENKRRALVAYFLEYAQRNEAKTVILNGEAIPNPKYWTDANALFKYYLIDVEMSACQLTSRIKQALSSVQFFVQRCFLNLENRYVQVSQDEKEDASSPNAWSQWKWMKNYRIWEANRKVFFYPENWIEPELRDDKSPFFKELENDILQNEITHDNVETAYLNYLHKVDEVAHLDVCGVYHEQEDLGPGEVLYERDMLHVVGRTKAVPHLYYYRRYDLNYSTWSAWEKIDLDITGDQLVPVVYNRKLHLFWLVAVEKPLKVKKIPSAQPTSGTSKTQDAQEPAKYWEIQLAWSVLKHTGWSPKKVSSDKLIHPWERPFNSYLLKPYYFASLNQLYLDVYISTSKQFNGSLFYNQATGERQRLTKTQFSELYSPWHSSAFVFDGEVQSTKLNALRIYSDLSFWGTSATGSDSLDLVKSGFGEDGKPTELLQIIESGPKLRLPEGMHFTNNRLTNNQLHGVNNNRLNVLSGTVSTTLLNGARNPFEIVATQQFKQFDSLGHPLFYQDRQRAFFIKPEIIPLLDNYNQPVGSVRKFRFLPFYHPYTPLFIRELNRKGLDGLLKRQVQVSPQTYPPVNNFNFSSYAPTANTIVDATAQKDNVDFSLGGAYAIYNWELFFHAPLLIANKLTQNQRFEEAMRWYHYIFDPTNIDPLPTPQRYWITKPFFEYNDDDYRQQRIEEILKNIGDADYQEQLKAWRNDPFKPHLIARYRPVAYQKAVVMKYIDNLIAWGDMLFRRDSIESINEASLLYMLAYEILGDRPIKVPNVRHEDKSFDEIEAQLDDFGNTRIDVILEDTSLPIEIVPSNDDTEPMPKIDTFYFCIPNNDALLKYWDTVEDRLFKIRHCMNIEGVVRQLALFEPPIDPALLVKAAAAGIDLGSVLNDLAAGTPYYRFRVTVQKAIEFCNEVTMLGDRLLGVIEKNDAEGLVLLRSQHEVDLLKAVKEVRKKQIDEAMETIGGLNKAFEMAERRESYYNDIPRMNTLEDLGAVAHGLGIASEIVATISNTVAAGIYLIPQFKAGAAGFGATPTALVEFGGDQAGKSASKFAALFQGISTILHSGGSMLEAQGAYTRRDEENKQQAQLATIEKDQIQFQINGAEIRQAIAEKELENHELQIEQSTTTDEYLRNKYSNVQLYSWMLTQVSGIYFQAYQLAYDMAKKAEKCYQHELGDTATSFVQPVYWDSLKKGLLSGNKLMHDLRRLEAAYLDNNKRELEIRKHISLAQMFPLQLVQLRETGKCTLSLPEWLFNMDYPGHYFRRIKNVSISIPCVVGPYTSINCTLSLIKSTIRLDATGAQYEATDENDARFRTQRGAITSIATSHAQNDGGMFELNFNDERYLPFEGLGVVSEWLVELPKENNYFDFASLSDAILHLNYTARNGGATLAGKAMTHLDTMLPANTARLFDLRHEFPNEWHLFKNPAAGASPELVFNVKTEHYPFFARPKLGILQIKQADLWVLGTDNLTADIKVTSGASLADVAVEKDANYADVPHAQPAVGNVSPTGEVRIKIKTADVLNQVENVYLLLRSA